LAPPLEAKASRVLRFLAENESDFYDPSFARQLGALAVVPVQLPPDWVPPSSPLAGTNGGGLLGVRGGGVGIGHVGSGHMALVRFGDAAVPKDRHLLWTVAPVVPPHLVPPQMMWSSLGLQTPPPLELVLAHLRRLLSRGTALLDRWPPEAVDPPQVPFRTYRRYPLGPTPGTL
jgi:hypothetical protein